MYNGHGDVTAILDASSNVIASYYYDAFGVHLSSTGAASNPYRYSGYIFDEETGLYYLKARYYDPETARFLSEDTYLGQAGDPLSLNLYAYVKYNPLKYYDPTGHYVSETDRANLSPDQIALLEKLTKGWEAAYARGDADGMKIANDAANAVRNSAGYSGGNNGLTYYVETNNTVKTVVLEKQSSLTNNGTVNNVYVNSDATATVTNNGSIGTFTNNGTATVNNYGTINEATNNGSMNLTNYDGGYVGTANTSTGSYTGIYNSGTISDVNISTGSNVGIYNGGTVGNVRIINKETNTVTAVVPDEIILYIDGQIHTGRSTGNYMVAEVGDYNGLLFGNLFGGVPSINKGMDFNKIASDIAIAIKRGRNTNVIFKKELIDQNVIRWAVSKSHRENNQQLEFDGYIDKQNSGNAAKIQMGFAVTSNACGWIAAYNALLTLGITDIQPWEIVDYFENENGLLFDGIFGVNPTTFKSMFNDVAFTGADTYAWTLFPFNNNIEKLAQISDTAILCYLTKDYKSAHFINIYWDSSIGEYRTNNGKVATFPTIDDYIRENGEGLISLTVINIK